MGCGEGYRRHEEVAMSGGELRAVWLRVQVLLVLLLPLVLAGTPTTRVLAVGLLALVAAVLVVRPTRVPVPVTRGRARLRAWADAERGIERAEEPDRPGRPRPRAPGGGCAAFEL
jgi:hypothetical protein